ncbi:ribonuclease P protein component [Synechococcus sp. ATX 2A4]|uniref:ribonuclease P protein component n=1 Tax=Synechococcus sp. ATX 2A4 TaxID=2823727 RepID=UPI0020CFD5E6|nr:ribonuclease P protein component [Synechococcus sp. ATX 2A4]MCP9884511.1 ribonuclease P protein component [Synechococcus sp. ATX 2A4]
MALPAGLRLRSRRAFDRLYRSGRRLHGSHMVLRVLEADPSLLSASSHHPASACRCAVVVSSKVSKLAVRRNQLRRRLHTWLHQRCAGPMPSGRALWLLLSLKPGSADADPEVLLGECEELFRKAGLNP